jgi:hypothetical protein
MSYDHAIAQVISHQLPIAAAQVQYQVMSFEIYGRWSGTGAGYLWVPSSPANCNLTNFSAVMNHPVH